MFHYAHHATETLSPSPWQPSQFRCVNQVKKKKENEKEKTRVSRREVELCFPRRMSPVFCRFFFFFISKRAGNIDWSDSSKPGSATFFFYHHRLLYQIKWLRATPILSHFRTKLPCFPQETAPLTFWKNTTGQPYIPVRLISESVECNCTSCKKYTHGSSEHHMEIDTSAAQECIEDVSVVFYYNVR